MSRVADVYLLKNCDTYIMYSIPSGVQKIALYGRDVIN